MSAELNLRFLGLMKQAAAGGLVTKEGATAPAANAIDLVETHTVDTVTTDFDGRAKTSVAAGHYYLYGSYKIFDKEITWYVPIQLKAGENRLTLDQNNALPETNARAAVSPEALHPGALSNGWVGKGRTNTATPYFDVMTTELKIKWTHKGAGTFVLQVCDSRPQVIREFRHQGDGEGLETVTVAPGRFYLIPMGDEWTVGVLK